VAPLQRIRGIMMPPLLVAVSAGRAARVPPPACATGDSLAAASGSLRLTVMAVTQDCEAGKPAGSGKGSKHA